MIDVLNATDVRKNWGQFNDDVIRKSPRIVKRNRDRWMALSTTHLQNAFKDFTFTMKIMVEEDQSYTATIEPFDIVENAETKEELFDLLIAEIKEYADDYLTNFNLYSNSPNRKNHMPYIMNVLAQENDEGIKALISCPPGEK